MVVYGTFLELHDYYTGGALLVRADMIQEIHTLGDITCIAYVGIKEPFVVDEDYETVRGLLGQIYGKKD